MKLTALRICPVIPSSHVTPDVGTGLVHIAPVHGHEDWELGKKYNLPVRTLVDNNGRFTNEINPVQLRGRVAMKETDGINEVMNILKSGHQGVCTIGTEKITHSYPYDWRTKSPVMIKASKQWFLDLKEIKLKAVVRFNKFLHLHF